MSILNVIFGVLPFFRSTNPKIMVPEFLRQAFPQNSRRTAPSRKTSARTAVVAVEVQTLRVRTVILAAKHDGWVRTGPGENAATAAHCSGADAAVAVLLTHA
jgi:uncharacterized membrane protein YebE (DUF533 family)